MSDYKLFKFDWKIAWMNILVGIMMSTLAVAIIFGYNNTIYDIDHVLLFLIATIAWIMFVIKDH